MRIYEKRELMRIAGGSCSVNGHLVRWTYWSYSAAAPVRANVLTIEGWRSETIPAWLLEGLKFLEMVIASNDHGEQLHLDPNSVIERVENGGVVPGSFRHDFYRLKALDIPRTFIVED